MYFQGPYLESLTPTKRRLVEATVRSILHRGFAATSIDQICAEAGVTKGAFFHYFKSKDEIGQAAMEAWASHGMSLYAIVRADANDDPLDQVYRLIDLMISMIEGSPEPVTCVIGMMAQETSLSNPALRDLSGGHLNNWVQFVAPMLAEAKLRHPPRIDFDPESLAWMLHSLWQGSMLAAKSRQEPVLIVRNLRHARAYIDYLFDRPPVALAA